MDEQKVKKRGWIKNVAIIFLAVMLVLTFFSNTIMNRSLPEVAGQYVSSGTITAKIRGSGTVTANESYDVILNQTRTVAAVNVKLGDTVSTGDLLFTMGEAESEELTQAQEELNTLLLNYEKAVIQAGGSGESLDIRYAREDLKAAQEELAKNIYKEQDIADAQAAVTSATLYRDSCQASVEFAQANLDALGGLNTGGNSAEYQAKIREIEDKKTEITSTQTQLDAAKLTHGAKYAEFETLVDETMKAAGLKNGDDATAAEKTEWNNKRPAYILSVLEGLEKTEPRRVAYETIHSLETSLADKKTELNRLQQDLAQIGSSDNSYQYNQLSKRLTEAKNLLATAEASLTTAQNELKTLQDKKDAWQAANEQVKSCQKNLETLLINAQVSALDMQEMQRQLQQKREAVAKLEADSSGATVTSPVNGVIKQINVTAGKQTESGSPMAVIEVTDRGYSISFPVTVEQSKKVTVGDTAEVSSWWYGEQPVVTLSAIRNDPENPTSSKLLVFDVTGKVESGTQMNLSIGQNSANYDLIVPNSAIRSDTNGDFVLISTVKSSPLGNRYMATRVDVKVLAKDDINCAVSGGLGSWDYVITTSTKPLEPGMLVRLVENNG